MPDNKIDTDLQFKHYIGYAGVIIIGGLLRILPFCVAAQMGRIIVRLYCYFSGRSSTYIQSQMRECFGDKYTEKEYNVLVSQFYTHLGKLCAEFVRLRKANKDNIDQYVDWGDFIGIVNKLIAENSTGVIFATGHIGNWEFTGSACHLKGILEGAIARPLDNPLLDELVKRERESSGLKIWDKDGALIKALRSLKDKKSIGVLIDQDGGEQGMQVPFLGRKSSTDVRIAKMSITRGVPIIPSAIIRVPGKSMKFRLVYGKPIIPENNPLSLKEMYRIIEQMNLGLSAIVAEYPEQWLWTHKRWKTPNPSDKRLYRKYE